MFLLDGDAWRKAEAVSLALRSGFSRIPVIRDGLDDVVGVLYLKDVIRRMHADPAAATATIAAALVSAMNSNRSPGCPSSRASASMRSSAIAR